MNTTLMPVTTCGGNGAIDMKWNWTSKRVMARGARGSQGHAGMALASPPRRSTAVTAASAHTSVCQWRTLAGAAAKQQRMMLEASKGMIRGQGRERRRRNAIQEMRVKIVSSAGVEEVEVEAVSGAMQANAGR